MKKSAALIIFMVVLWSPGYGRIGETIEECITRYGEPQFEVDLFGRPAQVFKKSGYIISVLFYERKVDLIMFVKEDEDYLGFSLEISDNELEILLKSNGDGNLWEPLELISLDESWATIDKTIIAHYGYLNHALTFSTIGFLSRTLAKEKAEEEKSLDGF